MDKIQELFQKNKALEVLTGSRLYGTNLPESDYDIRGVTLPPKEYGFKRMRQVEFAKENILYEFRYFIELAMDNNPNVLEILFVNEKNILFKNKYGQMLLDMRDEFPYQGLIGKFLCYSRSQKHKMYIKKENYHILCDTLEKLEKSKDIEYLNEMIVPDGKDFIKIADLNFQINCKVVKAIKIIKNRIEKLSRRTLEGNETINYKFAMHLIRLLYECLDFVTYGKTKFPFNDHRLEFLMEIRNGKWDKEMIIDYAESLESEIESMIPYTVLRKEKNYDTLEKFTIDVIEKWLKEN